MVLIQVLPTHFSMRRTRSRSHRRRHQPQHRCRRQSQHLRRPQRLGAVGRLHPVHARRRAIASRLRITLANTATTMLAAFQSRRAWGPLTCRASAPRQATTSSGSTAGITMGPALQMVLCRPRTSRGPRITPPRALVGRCVRKWPALCRLRSQSRRPQPPPRLGRLGRQRRRQRRRGQRQRRCRRRRRRCRQRRRRRQTDFLVPLGRLGQLGQLGHQGRPGRLAELSSVTDIGFAMKATSL